MRDLCTHKLTRREALAGAAGLFLTGVAKAAAKKHFPISCGSWSYSEQFTSGKMDIFAFLDACHSMKLDGVDINIQRCLKSTTPAYLKQVVAGCKDRGLIISSALVSTEFAKSAEGVPKELETARRAMEIGVALGAPVLRVMAGSPPSANKREEAFRRTVDALRQCSEMGAKMGMVVALQNHGGLTCSGDDMVRFVREVNHPNFALLPDTGYFNGRDGPNGTEIKGYTYADYYHSIEQVAPFARLWRAKLYNLDANGREKWIDYDRFFSILRAAHYTNFVSIEYEGEEDPMTAIPRGARFLKSFDMS